MRWAPALGWSLAGAGAVVLVAVVGALLWLVIVSGLYSAW